MSVTVVATIIPLPEYRAEVITALEVTISQVHANDPGCELYALHEGDDRLVMIEKWTSTELLEAHGKGPELVALGKVMSGKLVSAPEIQRLAPHPAGTAEQGTL